MNSVNAGGITGTPHQVTLAASPTMTINSLPYVLVSATVSGGLQGVAQAGIDARAGRPALIVQDMLPGLAALAPETLAPASLHLSANSVQELATAVQHLAGNSNGPPLPVITGSAAAGAAQ